MLTNNTTSENWKKYITGFLRWVSRWNQGQKNSKSQIPNHALALNLKDRKPWMVGSVVKKKTPIMLKGYCFQLQNNEPKNHGWILSYMNGPRQNWNHNTLPGVVCNHIETIKGEFSSERSLLFVPIYYIYIQTIKGGTSVSENPLHHQLKYSSCSLFSHGEWPLMYPSLLPPTNDFSLPQNLDFVE